MRRQMRFYTCSVPFAVVLLLASATCLFGQESVLYSFNAGKDGSLPYTGVIVDQAGNLYGTTAFGGVGSCSGGCGTVFKLTHDSEGGWAEKVIHDFLGDPTDGLRPFGSLVLDVNGNLYGTTLEGGLFGPGIVFKLSPSSDGIWTEQVLYNFTGGFDGGYPAANLIFDKAGNLYGTTTSGGANNSGTVFELKSVNEVATEQVLYSFTGTNGDGALPSTGLIFDQRENLYGTTSSGGVNYSGIVFRLRRTGADQWTEEILHAFGVKQSDGYTPSSGLIFDAAGNLYGMTRLGPGKRYGCIYELKAGVGTYQEETILYGFTGEADGRWPGGGVVFDAAGNLYGMTGAGGTHVGGTIFELTPTSTSRWDESVLVDFGVGAGGYDPLAGLTPDGTGAFYGTVSSGGNGRGQGVVFQITP